MRPTDAAFAVALLWGGTAAAQGALDGPGSPFGGFKHDRTEPIEITADALEVREAESIAVFSGDVVAGQGKLRLTATTLSVWYDAEGGDGGEGDIDRLRAEGEVFMTSGEESARGAWAEYDVAEGTVTMGGGVVLSQGPNAVSGERLVIDLNVGRGRIEGGRVRSVFRPSSVEDR